MGVEEKTAANVVSREVDREAQNGVEPVGQGEVLAKLTERANEFYWRLTEVASPELLKEIAPDPVKGGEAFLEGLAVLLHSVVALPGVARQFSATWPVSVRQFVPGAAVGVALERTWGPVLAYVLLHALPGTADPEVVFDELDLRAGLAEAFAEVGLKGEDSWRCAARVRLLLGRSFNLENLRTRQFWAQGDVRWLAGVNDSGGVTYVNKESFEELLCWLQLPGLLGIARGKAGKETSHSGSGHLAALESALHAECERMADAGFDLRRYLDEEPEAEPATEEGEVIAH